MSLDWDEDEEPAPRKRSIAWRVAFLIVVLLGSAALIWAWQRYDAKHQQNIRESQALMETSRNRFLTEAEFDRVIALLNCDTETAQLTAIVTLEIVVARAPSLHDRAIAALEGCQTTSPVVREEAARAIDRLKARPQWYRGPLRVAATRVGVTPSLP